MVAARTIRTPAIHRKEMARTRQSFWEKSCESTWTTAIRTRFRPTTRLPLRRVGGKPEIYAYGVRNSWGISFDRGGTHELFAADVGQNRFEEVNIIVKGGNYGWNAREGFSCFDPKSPNNPTNGCPKVDADGKPFIDPIIAYKNFTGFKKDPESLGISVTGGYVYRGKAIPQLQGKYVFGDWSKNWALPMGTVFVASRPSSSGEQWKLERLNIGGHPNGSIPQYIVAFGQDAEGELYVLTNGRNAVMGRTGKVFKLVPRSSS